MLAPGDDTHLERLRRTFDFGLKAQDPKTGWFSDAIRNDGSTNCCNPQGNCVSEVPGHLRSAAP
jgi:hypothetical protein